MTKTTDTPDYKKLNDELTELLADLEAGELDIDEAVARYERGLEIIKVLETRLLNAEHRINKLKLP